MDELAAHTRVRVTAADLARQTGISSQVISKWKGRAILPEPGQLAALARGTGLNYLELLDAALRGKRYLPYTDEPMRASSVYAQETLDLLEQQNKKGGGSGDSGSTSATTAPAPGPANQPGRNDFTAVASGGGTEEEAAEADRRAAAAKAKQQEAIEEMEQKKRERESGKDG